MIEVPWWGWTAFAGVLLVLLGVDLFVHRGGHADNRRRALVWTGVWIGAGLAFNLFVWIAFGGQAAQEYLGAYLIEKSLSLDNLFVFLVLFRSLSIPRRYQHEVLFWGIFGALVFRALFIWAGVRALERWEWVAFVFGALLVVAAVRLWREDPAEATENRAVHWLSRHLPVTRQLHGHHFLAVENGRRVATPLLLALVGLELTDIVFAIDSVPAAFAITREPFLIYSSNAFAILGLRSLYLVLAHSLARLRTLHYGLAVVLGFAGLKIVTARWVEVPPLLSVGIIVAILAVSIAHALHQQRRAGAVTEQG